MTFAAASALEANKHQDSLVQTHVYFPFYIKKKKNSKHIKDAEMEYICLANLEEGYYILK